MKREIFGDGISQKSKSEMFSATDLIRAGNKKRLSLGKKDFNFTAFMNSKQTSEFVGALEKKFGKVIIKGRGRSAHTWVHPLLFIDIALAISPELKIEVYEWIHDNLLKYRNDSGDSYKKMCGALYELQGNKRDFYLYIQEIAERIKKECGVKNWETATESQLDLRDRMHNFIFLLSGVMNNKNEAVRLGILKAKS